MQHYLFQACLQTCFSFIQQDFALEILQTIIHQFLESENQDNWREMNIRDAILWCNNIWEAFDKGPQIIHV